MGFRGGTVYTASPWVLQLAGTGMQALCEPECSWHALIVAERVACILSTWIVPCALECLLVAFYTEPKCDSGQLTALIAQVWTMYARCEGHHEPSCCSRGYVSLSQM
jgi:hypothetical protein